MTIAGQIWSGLLLSGVTIRNISQAKAELSSLIEEVCKGKEIILAKAGKPVARIVPYKRAGTQRKPGSMAGEIWICAGL